MAGSRTGGWFVSSCQGELGPRAEVALRTVASFFGGRGFSLGKDCAPPNARPSKQHEHHNYCFQLDEWIHDFFFLFLFPAALIVKVADRKGAKNLAGKRSPPDLDPL